MTTTRSEPPVLFIAGTGQHSGKTLVALGLVMEARSRGLDARYMKPVGQRTVVLGDRTVDEDVALLMEVCALPISPAAASPVTVPSGFTRSFLEKGFEPAALEKRILEAFEEVRRDADVVFVEGTGHAGVGSVVGLSNARVASLLNAQVIIVTGGGIGRPIDEFCLNEALFAREGVGMFGVVLNKVLAAKMEEIREPVTTWMHAHGVAVLGLIPYDQLLSKMTVAQIARETGADVLCGPENLDCLIEKVIVGAEPPHRFLDSFGPGVLALIPGDRDDLVLAAVSAQGAAPGGPSCFTAAICLTSGILPHANTMAIARRSGLPVLAVKEGMFAAASRISDLVAKMTSREAEKVERAYALVSKHLDLSTLHAHLGVTT